MLPLIHNFFSILKFFWKTNDFLYKVFRFGPVRQKISTKPWCPPSYAWKFSIKNFSETTKCSPLKYFGTVRQKLFDGKSWYLPPLLSIKTFSLPEIFWNTEWFPGEVFSVLWDKKNFDKTVKLPPSFAWKFSIPEFFRSVLLRILSALWDKNFSTELSDIPFLCIKYCDTRNFLKHRTVPQRNFLVMCDKSFRRRNVIPPSLMHKVFRYPKFSDKPKCSPTKFFGSVSQKILNEKSSFA